MRVDIVSKEYPPEIYGGAGVHVTELVAALRGATARWRALTAEAEAMDGKWQAARRHKYKQRLRTSMRGLKLALARRHAKMQRAMDDLVGFNPPPID